ncbi:MAG TPA: 3'(2'),5'-bisphosphate nucleotidase CysQ [Azospirillaceae bacterium]|nr:3'(2'),5'-bisphosphate nucleotidase CysQ [Azospirillaceae bacterium]
MPQTLLSAVRSIAREAGAVILRYYNDTMSVETKADGSPVTQADQAAEHVILPALHHLAPGVPVVAEEAVAAGHVPDISGGRFWLVDPLDGTKEFIKRNGEFTVNIALIENGVPVLGVVYAPALGELYAGAGPGTAIAWDDLHPHHDHPISARAIPADGATVVASRSHGDPAKLDAFLANYTVKETCGRGSSLKFCLIAKGEADLYPRFGPTCEWDTAAGHAVLLAAGGRVETVDGRSLTYGGGGKFLNPEFIAYGKP